MKIALAQINTTVGAFDDNVGKIISYTQKAQEAACDLIVFPELAICGYPPQDLLGRPDFVQQNYLAISNICAHAPRDIGIIVGFAEENLGLQGKPMFNTVGLIYNGAMLEKRYKRLLPDYDIFDEGRYFEPGAASKPVLFKGVKLGLTICEDAWHDHHFTTQMYYEADPVQELMDQNAAVIINISGSPYDAHKHQLRTTLHQRLCKKYGVPLVFVNQVGGNDSLIFDGASCAYDSQGNIIAQAVDFAQDLIMVDLDKNKGHLHKITESKNKAMMKALVLGIRDFVQKNGFAKGLVGLSGGIDSALVLVLGTLALGRENVRAVYMPSLYSSNDNLQDTTAICKNLDVELDTLPIGDLYKAMAHMLNDAFDENNPALAEQNLQARIRGTLLMGYSNRDGSLLLSTGNKSEIATGYCTLYGDMCGALSVLGDIYKTDVYALSYLINQMYGREIIPQRILDKAPSAELRPNQKDMDELPEYPELDLILHKFIEENQTVEELLSQGFPEKAVHDTIRRMQISEHKRFQAAPILRVSTKAFGMGRRYPLAHKFDANNCKS